MSNQYSLKGVLLFVTGLLLFAGMDASVKFLTAHYPVPMIAALRYFVNALLMVALLAPTQGRALIKTQRTGWVIVRAISLSFATLFMGFALHYMPMAEATAIGFLSPLLVILVAGPMLKEKITVLDWMAVLGGFMGILLIVRPGGDVPLIGALFGIGLAVVLTVYQILSRMLAPTESTIAMLFFTTLVGSLVFGLGLPWYWTGGIPPPEHLILFFIAGSCGGMGHFLFTAAYRAASASALAPLIYVQLLWAVLLGWLIFGDVPDAYSVLGMTIVTACGVVAALRSQRASRKALISLNSEP